MKDIKEKIVVTYSISTSNHNLIGAGVSAVGVVTYSISTSNHNAGSIMWLFPGSYVVLMINKMDSELPAK